MNYILMPLDFHYDSGFGAIASSFRSAALQLKTAVPKPAFFEHLPQSFLFRHRIELFLKSGIVILHRKLQLPYGKEPSTATPMVLVAGKWRAMHNVHSISVLYEYWKSIFTPRLEELKGMCRGTTWEVNAGADDWVRTIEAIDPRSTYSHYPSMRDAQEDKAKSPFKSIPLEDLLPDQSTDGEGVMALLIENTGGEIVRAFAADKGKVQDAPYMEALEAVCDMLFNYHAMMRHELTGGF